jgi:acyl transferase domain-containing protein
VQRLLAMEGHRVALLSVGKAFHSRQMDPILAPFASFADAITANESIGNVCFMSTALGSEVSSNVPLDGYHWSSHLRNRVRFRECVMEARRRGCSVFLEIGPGGMLRPMVSATLGDQVSCLVSLDPNQNDPSTTTRSLAELHCRGVNADLRRGNREFFARRMDLPRYPFQRRSYPLDSLDPAALLAPRREDNVSDDQSG